MATREENELPAAHWMSGKWGIGYRIPAGDSDYVRDYNVKAFIRQIKTSLSGASWVVVNLTNGASGDRCMAPHSVLTTLNPGSTPKTRDLFGEIADALQKINVKVIAYVATQGPALLKHGCKCAYDKDGDKSPAMDRWNEYIKERYGCNNVETLERAFAEIVIDEYAGRYGTRIDGWWFDHAKFGNIPLLHKVVKKHNPRAAIAFNQGQNVPLTINNPGYEDYTAGHPFPVKNTPASSKRNLPMITAVENKTRNGYFTAKKKGDQVVSLGHGFYPVAEKWNGGNNVWTLDRAVRWKSRMLAAGGAWSWNLPRDKKNPSILNREQVAFLSEVVKAMNQNNGASSCDPDVKVCPSIDLTGDSEEECCDASYSSCSSYSSRSSCCS